jgi:hypothetical protein
LRAANTLRTLAAVYERPPREFERVNEERGWALDEPLTGGERVNVPDPEFGPLLAARLAGLVLADGTLPDPERVRLIQSLVPLAAANPTALDTVLARLVLAWRPTDPGVLAMLRQAIAQHVAPPPADLALPNLPA